MPLSQRMSAMTINPEHEQIGARGSDYFSWRGEKIIIFSRILGVKLYGKQSVNNKIDEVQTF